MKILVSTFLFQRLMKQLDPFDPIYRPILFKVKNQNIIKEMENVRKTSEKVFTIHDF